MHIFRTGYTGNTTQHNKQTRHGGYHQLAWKNNFCLFPYGTIITTGGQHVVDNFKQNGWTDNDSLVICCCLRVCPANVLLPPAQKIGQYKQDRNEIFKGNRIA